MHLAKLNLKLSYVIIILWYVKVDRTKLTNCKRRYENYKKGFATNHIAVIYARFVILFCRIL